jgi:hypothetical protein
MRQIDGVLGVRVAAGNVAAVLLIFFKFKSNHEKICKIIRFRPACIRSSLFVCV